MPRHIVGGPRRHVILTQPQDEKLNQLARKTGMTPSEHIRRAMDAYFRLLERVGTR